MISSASARPASALPARAWLEPISLALAMLLVAKDSADALGRGLHALVDWHQSNIGDPWPTAVAATRLASHWQAPLYDDFNPVGSSFIYPPLAAAPFLPFAGLGYEATHHALSIVSRIAWLACAGIAAHLAWDRARPAASALFALAGAFAFYPLLRAVELNQSTLLVSAALGTSLVLASRGRDAASGAAFACAAALKPQLAIVVALVAFRSRKFAAFGAASLVGLGLASLIVGGLANHVRYVTTVLPALSGGYAFYPNQSWSATFLRLGGAPPFDFALAPAMPIARAASAVLALSTLVYGVVVLRRKPAHGVESRDGDDLALAIAFAWLVVTLASPISWEHHYAPALFLFAILFHRGASLPLVARALACIAFPLVAGYIDVRGFSGVLGRIAMSYVMLGGWLLAAAAGTSGSFGHYVFGTVVGRRVQKPGSLAP